MNFYVFGFKPLVTLSDFKCDRFMNSKIRFSLLCSHESLTIILLKVELYNACDEGLLDLVINLGSLLLKTGKNLQSHVQ